MRKFLLGALHAAFGGALSALVASQVIPIDAQSWKIVISLAFSGAITALYCWWQKSPVDIWTGEERRK